MEIQKYINTSIHRDVAGLWFVSTDSGTLEDHSACTVSEENGSTVCRGGSESIGLTAVFTPMKNDVVRRQDTLKNLSDRPVTLHGFTARFAMEGDQYQVYTQYNSNLHESSGAWQDLVTRVVAADGGIRTCQCAAPFMAMRSVHNGRITVFHLLPNCQWEMTAGKYSQGGWKDFVSVNIGMESAALRLVVAPGEEICLPTIYFYETANATDFDAYRFHEVYNDLYPRRRTPVMYNTWYYHFDHINVDGILEQVDAAADLGVEYFVVDAGWYGGGRWFDCVGDWVENLEGGFRGRLLEVADRVRAKGMIFGLWFEPARAGISSQALKDHPDYYFDHSFLDLANPDARDFLFDSVTKIIDQYGIGFVKFDFNANIPHDPSGNAFYRYLEGQRLFMQRIKARYPDLYINNCASGGQRMELQQGTMYDSFWFSDNNGPYEGLTILKNTLKRMPTGLIERWNIQNYCEGFPTGNPADQGRMISCNSYNYEYVLNVPDDYIQNFLTGGPLGFSGDISHYPPYYKERLRNFLAQYKRDRSFYAKAVARLLIDTTDISAIEYADPDLERCVIQLFTKLVHAVNIRVYPAVDPDAQYRMGEKTISGRTLTEDGILFENLRINNCVSVELRKV